MTASSANESAGPLLHRYIGQPCAYCARPMVGPDRLPTRDHKRPRSQGTTLGDGNCAICCRKCNSDKRNMTLEQFFMWLDSSNDPRAANVASIIGLTKPRLCVNCRHYGPLSPGKAAICFEKWRYLEWNEAVPLADPKGTCEKHSFRVTPFGVSER